MVLSGNQTEPVFLTVNNDCDVNAICTQTEYGFDCNCQEGYSGDGTNCFLATTELIATTTSTTSKTKTTPTSTETTTALTTVQTTTQEKIDMQKLNHIFTSYVKSPLYSYHVETSIFKFAIFSLIFR